MLLVDVIMNKNSGWARIEFWKIMIELVQINKVPAEAAELQRCSI